MNLEGVINCPWGFYGRSQEALELEAISAFQILHSQVARFVSSVEFAWGEVMPTSLQYLT